MTLQPTYDYSNRVSANCYTHGRGGLAPTVLVCHSTCGTNDDNSITDPVVALARSNAAANYLCNNDRQVSVQWLIGAEAAGAPIYRIVPESDTSYHAGGTPNYPSAWHDPATNKTYTGFYAPTNCSIVNAISVGIEVFGQANDVLGPNQRKAVVLLVTDIVSRYPVMAQPGHVVAHASLEGDRTDGRNWVALAGAAATNTVGANKVPTPAPIPAPLPPVYQSFPQTGHGLGHDFLQFFNAHGGVPIFGYPITEEMRENGLTVQYMERARFEYHPENPVGQQVMLGLVGKELLNLKQLAPH